jgi:hypothetical protein
MKSNAQHVSPEFSPDELLIFIGHSDDASAEVEAVMSLRSEIEKMFGEFLKVNLHRSRFRRWNFWEWGKDALTITGGQEAVVKHALDHARVAIFIFKERVGKVTWQELEQVRERSREQHLHILALFPEEKPYQGKFPNAQAKLQASRDWTALLERQEELTSDWTSTDSCSVTPCPTYQSIEELKNIVRDKVRVAMADILAVESPILRPTPLPQVNTASDFLRLYQATLMRQLGNMTLTGSPALEHFATKLSDTFVSLSLSGSVRSETRFCKGVEQCDFLSDERSRMPEQVMKFVLHEQNHPLLLIIGDPGSGKTTLLKHYAHSCLNEQRYGEFGFGEPVNVFFLSLRELNIGDGSDISLADNLASMAKKQFLAIDAAQFSDWLDQPSTCAA